MTRRAAPILCINCGSSSIKFALYQCAETEETLLAKGSVKGIGSPDGHLSITGAQGETLVDVQGDFPQLSVALDTVLDRLARLDMPPPVAAGHRIVHGGNAYTDPQRIDAQCLETLRALIPFAPLHQPSAIEGIDAIAARLPALVQVACFDTAFHHRLPELAQRFPLPRALWQEGIRRYGFHGLSYAFIVETLGAEVQGRAIIAHLGSGSSLVALHNGHPLDTTMGLTPTGGVMMGTRSGDLDPGILLYLLQAKHGSGEQLAHLLNHEAGLLGVSDLSSDMQKLLDQRGSEPRAAQAVEMFCYQLRKQIGALTAVLGGLDTLVFTGGMGEQAAAVRWEVCQGLTHLGVVLDAQRNEAHARIISTAKSACCVQVIATNEELMIARHTRDVLFTGANAVDG
jgi:acetate kinase